MSGSAALREDPSRAQRGGRVGVAPDVAAALAFLIGLLALIGWAADIPLLRSIAPQLPPMMPLTAAGLLLSAASLWLQRRPGVPRLRRTAAAVCAVLAGAIGVLTMVEYVSGAGLGFDDLLFPATVERVAPAPYAGRPGPYAAVSLVLAAATLLALDARRAWLPQLLALAGAAMALQSLVGIAYGVEELYRPEILIPSTLPTALGLGALFTALLLARPDRGWMAVVTRRDAGGAMARRLLPAIVLVPVAIGALTLLGQRAGFFGSRFRLSLAVVADIVVLALLVWWSARSSSRLERARERADAQRVRALERERVARFEAERSARQEAALRRSAGALVASLTVEEVMLAVAENLLDALAVAGAFLEQVDVERDELVVAASAGSRVPEPGVRSRYRGSWAERVIEAGAGAVVAPLRASQRSLPGRLKEACAECAIVFVPLASGGDAVGALAVIREPGQPGFAAAEVARVEAFAALAALALRRVQLLAESQRRREALERVTESRARLMRGFSHDVKNPLGAAASHAALLEDGVLGGLNERQRDAVSRIRGSITFSLELMDRLSEVVRAEAGRIEVRWLETDLRRVASEVAGEYRAQAQASGLELRVAVPARLATIESDPSRARQILANLISNAVKFTPPGGSITVRAAELEGGRAPGPGRWLCVDVSDTGSGIPRDRQEEIFGEFTRLAPGGTRGAGLGLAISRGLARALGGDLTVESEPGRGSTFTLWLPLRAPAASKRRAA